MIAIARAFVRRDFMVWTSYRLSLLWQVLGILTMFGIIYFIGQAVGEGLTRSVEGLSQDYFDFLLAGIAFTDVLTFGLNALPRTIRESQSAGTLEAMLLAHFRLFPIMAFSSGFGFLMSFARLLVYIIMAVAVFGLWRNANLLSAVVVFLLASLTFACLGILSASFILVFKKGDPVLGVYGLLSGLLGGVLFPVSILPQWIQPLAKIVPLFHALEGMRQALRGATLGELAVPLLSLAAMAIVLFPASIAAFNWAINRAKREGSLVQY